MLANLLGSGEMSLMIFSDDVDGSVFFIQVLCSLL